MKKVFFLTAFLLTVSFAPTFGQEEFKTQYYIGAGGSYLSTWIINQNTYGEPELEYKMTYGYGYNIIFGTDFDKHFGVKIEAGYARLGQKYDDTQYDQPTKRSIQFDYILIPVMMKYRVGGETAKFYVMAGPQLGMLRAANQEYTRNGYDAPPFYNDEIKDTIDVSQPDIYDRYTHTALFVRMDIGLELTIVKHFMINLGVTSAYSITDLNGEHWRMKDYSKQYDISHNFYAGANLGFCFRW
jgi:hypothetical protein